MKYSNLIGREVTYTSKWGNVPVVKICVVTGIERGVGLTLQEKDSGEYILCLNGPLSPVIKDTAHQWKNKKKFNKMLYFLAKQIYLGEITAETTLEYYRSLSEFKTGYTPRADCCPFSQ